MAERGLLFVVSGPSGVGKGTICKLLMAKRPDIRISVSCTTRAPRTGEVDGIDYFFVENKRFDEMIEQNELLEYAPVHDKRYGTPRFYVEQMLDEGHDVILEIDVQGGQQVMKTANDMTGIFILPPSYAELVARLMGRKTESEQQIRLRLKNSREELRAAEDYDYLIVNDNLSEAVDHLNAVITAQHHAFKHKHAHLQRMYEEFKEDDRI